MIRKTQMCGTFLAALLLQFMAPCPAWAGAPLKLNFQGRLNENGQPAEGSKTFVFRIYDAQSGGSLLWTGEQQVLDVSEGMFTAVLSTGTPADLSTATFSGARFIEMTVDGVPLSPRQEMVSAPYALVAQALAPDADLPPPAILAGSVTDYHVLLTTAAVSSGRFADDRVMITTGAFTGGFNGADQLVRLDAAGKLPALDGSAVTNVSLAQFSSVSSATETLRTDLDAVSVSTGVITDGLASEASARSAADVSIGVDTGTLRTDLDSMASSAVALASTQVFTGANAFSSTAAFTARDAALPGVMISSGLVVAAGRVGIGTASPASVLSVAGSISLPVTTVASVAGGTSPDEYYVSDADCTVLLNGASDDVDVYLPDAAGVPGRIYTFKRVDAAPLEWFVNIYGTLSQTIDGSSQYMLNSAQWQTVSIQSDGSNWLILFAS